MNMSVSRTVFGAVVLACAGLMGFGLYLQHVQGLEPCPLCILQRLAFIGCGLVALAGALHDPAGWGRRAYAALLIAVSGAGGGVAARQVWLQLNPPRTLSCGADMEYLLDSFPLTQALPMIFRGTGDCAKVQWTFLGISIPGWAFVCFLAICGAAVWLAFRRRP